MSRFREKFPTNEDAVKFICEEVGIPLDQVVDEESQAWLINWYFQGYDNPVDPSSQS